MSDNWIQKKTIYIQGRQKTKLKPWDIDIKTNETNKREETWERETEPESDKAIRQLVKKKDYLRKPAKRQRDM